MPKTSGKSFSSRDEVLRLLAPRLAERIAERANDRNEDTLSRGAKLAEDALEPIQAALDNGAMLPTSPS